MLYNTVRVKTLVQNLVRHKHKAHMRLKFINKPLIHKQKQY